MSCCTVTIVPFVSAFTTTIPYSGNKPTVTVSYLIEGVWQALGVATSIVFGAASVTIDHGISVPPTGPVLGATGVIKMLQ